MFPSSRPWRSLRCLILLCLIGTISVACTDEPTPAPTPRRTPIPAAATRPPQPTRASVSPDQQTWLVMLYDDADDEILEEDMLNDLNEAELVGSSDRVHIVAQMDRYDGGYDGDGDWTTAKRFLIQHDDDLDKLHSKELADLGEVNMADADTLIDFVTWATKTYPANKYVLIMSDHGAGWPGGWSDSSTTTDGRDDIPLAQSFGDMLFLMELGDALKQIVAATSIGQFELIGLDACLMSSLEVYSAVAPYARYAVASQEVEPSLGWAYAAWLGRLVDSPEIDGAELAKAIVDSYIDQDQQIVDDKARAKYVKRAYEYADNTTAEEIAAEESKSITLTGVDLARIPDLLKALDTLARALAKIDQKPVAASRRYAQAFETVFDDDQPKPYIDIGNFARLLKEKTNDRTVRAAADALIAAIGQAVIDEKHGEEKAGATGISIYFPNSKLYKDEDAGAQSYRLVAATFANQSLWEDFLAFHYTKRPLPASNAQQPTATPQAAAVRAPNAEPITIAPVKLSATTVTPTKPVILRSSVTGDNVSFIYIFIGYVDPKTNAIRVADMDFLDTERTKEVDGVFYPNWGASRTVDIEFEWDGQLFAVNDGRTSEQTLLHPKDFGASAEKATYTVEGTYTTAKGKKSRRARLLLSNGELIQVLGYTGKEDTGSLREVTPKRGDRFTILEDRLNNSDKPGEEARIFTKTGKTLVFGDENFTWEDITAPKGQYLVGFIAEDFDGNRYESHAVVTVKP
jgi:clostripain